MILSVQTRSDAPQCETGRAKYLIVHFTFPAPLTVLCIEAKMELSLLR
jgi:hypothetical protein